MLRSKASSKTYLKFIKLTCKLTQKYVLVIFTIVELQKKVSRKYYTLSFEMKSFETYTSLFLCYKKLYDNMQNVNEQTQRTKE